MVKVTAPQKFWQKSLNPDVKSLGLALVKMGTNAIFLQWSNVAESGVDALGALGLNTTIEEITGHLLIQGIINAIQDLLKDYQSVLPNTLTIDQTIINHFLNSTKNILIENSFHIDSDQELFDDPKQLPFLVSIQEQFSQWLITEKFVKDEMTAQQLSQRLPSYFVFALSAEWSKNPEQYNKILPQLETPFTLAEKRETGRINYRAFLSKEVEKPLFFEAFGLNQVYIPLRAYYEQEVKKTAPNIRHDHDDDHNDKNKKRIVIDLETELRNWLNNHDKDDALRVISGGPGSGKSSFGKIFASRIAEVGNIPILFIALHRFSVNQELIKAVGEYVALEGFLRENPLAIKEGEQPLLIIFDGLDELSEQGKIGAKVANDFIGAVQLLLTQFNAQKLCLQVIITGRTIVIQDNKNKLRKEKEILQLIPYFVTDEQRKKYQDDQELLRVDQRDLWWQEYGKVKGKNYQELPAELKSENLIDITAQPLLNYLLALSLESGQLQFTEETNLNTIYNSLLSAVYERAYSGTHKSIQGITQEEFVAILEEIALSCWHGNGRTTTIEDIENHCQSSDSKLLKQLTNSLKEDNQSSSILRLLMAFYFRVSGQDQKANNTFEFTHKSFGEYLTAKRIIRQLQKTQKNLTLHDQDEDTGWTKKEALIRWTKLCSISPLDQYLFQFILDEIKLQNPQTVKAWQEILCRLIEVQLNDGLPLKELSHLGTVKEVMRQSRNAEEALLIVLNACARVTKKLSEIEWTSPDQFGTWLHRLRGQRKDWNERILVLQCLGFLNLNNCQLIFQDLAYANLYLANLEGANLKGANLRGAILEGANLYGAILKGAILKGADLTDTILAGKDIEEITK